MKPFGLNLNKLIPNVILDIASKGSFLERADSARDAKRWKEAANLYAKAAQHQTNSADLLVQRANCLKEANDFAEAFHNYYESIRISPSADCDLQLGHLLKLSGNFAAALRAYRRASIAGDTRATKEIEAFPSLTSQSTNSVNFMIADRADVSMLIQAFDDIAACNLVGQLMPPLLRKAAKSLSLAGHTELAKSFYQLAFLEDGLGSGLLGHMSVILETGLWPLAHLSELSMISARRAAFCPNTSYHRMHIFVEAIIESLILQDGVTLARYDTLVPQIASWPPQALSVQESIDALGQLMDLLTQAYEALALTREDEGQRVIDTICALKNAVRPVTSTVAFFESLTDDQLRKFAGQTLNDCLANWLQRIESRFLGPFVTPAIVTTSLALKFSPVTERLAELGSPAEVISEIMTIISARPEPLTQKQRELVIVRVLLDWLPEATPADCLGFFEKILLSDYSLTALELSRCTLLAKLIDPIKISQLLKDAGLHQISLDFLDRQPQDTSATFDFLLEKALLAKITGNFNLSAELLERLVLLEPNNRFVQTELGTVLLEIEPIERILARKSKDRFFIDAVREQKNYNIPLGVHENVLGNALIQENNRNFILALDHAIQQLNSSQKMQEKIDIRVLKLGWLRRRGLTQEHSILRNIDFVRVRVSSVEPILLMRVRIDGKTISCCQGESQISPVIKTSKRNEILFNCWFDLSCVERGWHQLTLYFEMKSGGHESYQELVWVEPEPPSEEMLYSTAAVDLSGAALAETIEDRIASLPSVVFEAERSLFQGTLDSILVVRVDQLGDTSQSIPAMLQLAAAFPQARFECLTSRGNVDLLSELGIFAEINTVDSSYDRESRKRFINMGEQVRLRQLLEPKHFDLAVDLSPGFETQNLLLLANARHTAGFKPNNFHWLTYGVDIQSHDPVNVQEMMPHSAQISAFIASLVSVAKHRPTILPNHRAKWSALATFGVEPGDQFVLLHSGAGAEIRRWPIMNFIELARKLVCDLNIKTILLADGDNEFQDVNLSDLPNGLFYASGGMISFEALDTLVELCAVFVGNDSGPKHIAALRGAPVVSIHMGRVNWSEWGQDASGVIIARRVPCAGCGIELAEECGKGLPCLNDIKVDEVFAQVIRVIRPAPFVSNEL